MITGSVSAQRGGTLNQKILCRIYSDTEGGLKQLVLVFFLLNLVQIMTYIKSPKIKINVPDR